MRPYRSLFCIPSSFVRCAAQPALYLSSCGCKYDAHIIWTAGRQGGQTDDTQAVVAAHLVLSDMLLHCRLLCLGTGRPVC